MYIDFDPLGEESSLGKYLKSVREEKEISLDELSDSTRIKREYLEAIEADNYSKLPEGPYLNLFLKSYSEFLEIDYGIIQEYLEAKAEANTQKAKSSSTKLSKKKSTKQAKKPEPIIPKDQTAPTSGERKSEVKNYLMLIGAVIFIIFFVLILYLILTGKSDNGTEKTHQEPAVSDSQSIAKTPIDSSRLVMQRFYDSFDSLTLSVYPETQQALTVHTDGKHTTKLVTPNENWKVSARDSIFLACERIDNSRYYLNGFRLKLEKLDLAGENTVVFDRTNWFEYVDTMDLEL